MLFLFNRQAAPLHLRLFGGYRRWSHRCLSVVPAEYLSVTCSLQLHGFISYGASRWNGQTNQIELGAVGRILCFQPIVAKNHHGLEMCFPMISLVFCRKKEISFDIELVSGTSPILIAPYRIEPVEVKDLNEKLQELLERIHPTQYIPSSAPILSEN